jgi:hypothetical protein
MNRAAVEDLLKGLLWAAQNRDHADMAKHIKAMMEHWFLTKDKRRTGIAATDEKARMYLDAMLHEILRLAFIKDEFHPLRSAETLTQWRTRKGLELYTMLLGAAHDPDYRPVVNEVNRRTDAVIDACKELIVKGLPADDTPKPRGPALRLVT